MKYKHFKQALLFKVDSSLNFLKQKGIEVVMLSDNINWAAQKFFKICFQTNHKEKLGWHFNVYINIASFVVLVSCYRTKKTQGSNVEVLLQFFGMGSDEGYVFFSCFHFSFLVFGKLLPLQGARLIALIPRVLSWAGSFCPFRAYLNHMWKFRK